MSFNEGRGGNATLLPIRAGEKMEKSLSRNAEGEWTFKQE